MYRLISPTNGTDRKLAAALSTSSITFELIEVYKTQYSNRGEARVVVIEKLKQRLADVFTLGSVSAILDWDQQTYMPSGGVIGRSNQLAFINKLKHEMFISSETDELLSLAEKENHNLDPDSDDVAYLRMARREFEKKTKLPSELVEEIAQTAAIAHEDWVIACATSDYPKFAPSLQKTLVLQRRVADLLGYKTERYDALLDQYEPDMTTAEVRLLFEQLKPPLVALVKKITECGPDAIDTSVLRREFDEDKQREFAESVIRQFGFDFNRGRQDRATHPFCTSFSRNDVRITTRYDRNFLPIALFSTLHETGHALYDMNIGARYDANILGTGASLGIHESQSRLWENLIGRSQSFWKYYYPKLKAQFPTLRDVSEEHFYRAINRVTPSLIRVEADEVTYNLHIMLRFEMEVDLLEERISVVDAPEAWNAKCQEYLGITPSDDARGILQDIHWSSSGFGYFPTYTLGNILSVQFWDQANKHMSGQLLDMVVRGEFAPLREWLTENIHQWGSKYTPRELVQRATGCPLDPVPYLRYLQEKFGDIYRLN